MESHILVSHTRHRQEMLMVSELKDTTILETKCNTGLGIKTTD